MSVSLAPEQFDPNRYDIYQIAFIASAPIFDWPRVIAIARKLLTTNKIILLVFVHALPPAYCYNVFTYICERAGRKRNAFCVF